MKKKIILIILLVVITIFLTSCGSKTDESKSIDALKFVINGETIITNGVDIAKIDPNNTSKVLKDFCFMQESAKQYICPYQISFKITDEAVKRIGKKVSALNASNGFVSSSIEVYLNGVKIDELRLPESARKNMTSIFEISGVGHGAAKEEALANSQKEFDKIINAIKNK